MMTPHLQGMTSIKLDRRKFMAAAAGLVAAGVLPKSVLALAGPYSFKHGAFDLTVVSDGTFALPVAIIAPDAKPEEVKQILGLAADAETNPVELSPLLAKSGSDVVLFDAGTGGGMGPGAGMLVESLKAAGVDAAAVTKVVYTHAHPDHLWGTLTKDGKPVFANASYHMAEAEWNFWTKPDLMTMMPKDMEGMVKNTQAQLAAIKDKVAMFKPGAELVPGVNVIDTAGHTPGHVSFEFAGGDGLILTGDAITVPKVFFAHPDWKFGFDADGEAAGKSRRMLLDMAVSGKKQLLGYHWAYPGIGRAEAKDGAFAYVPGA
jgi:glyoxylase-like metal-dependent hydrolase (beta-lactamase superfamily II)